MIDMEKDDYIIGCWFAGGPKSDWLAHLYARKGEIVGKYRFRYHKDDKAFDSQDEKNWYQVGPLEDTSENRAKTAEAFTIMYEASYAFGFEEGDHFEGGTPEEFMEWFTSRPFVHVKEGKEADEYLRQNVRH